MMRIIISLILTFCLLGCSTGNDNNEIERTKLINAKSKWECAITTDVAGNPRTIVYDGKTQIADDELTLTNDFLSFIYQLPK